MATHIGIVAVSPEGAALFYRQLSRQASRLLPPNDHPTLTIHNERLSLYIDAIRHDDWHAVGRLLRRSAEVLARVGAKFCVTPDNAVLHGVHLAQTNSPIPWLSMVDLVAECIVGSGRKHVGVIGTKLVTRSSTYQTHLGLRGVAVHAPSDDDCETLEQIIYGELIYGQCRPESRQAAQAIVRRLADKGCEAVILGCSEAPLLITAESSPIPVYDAADILAEGAIRHAVRLSSVAAGESRVG